MNRLTSSFRGLIAVALIAASVFSLSTNHADAQPLVDRVPGDALVYVGWQGAKNLGPAYEESHFKAVLDASNARDIFKTMIPSLLQRIGKEDRNAAGAIGAAMAIGKIAWQHPTAIYFGGIELNDDGPPTIKFAYFIDAGNEAVDVVTAMSNMIDRSGAPLKVTSKAGLVTVSFGPLPKATGSLKVNKGFLAATKKLNANPVLIGYVDGEGLMALADKMIREEGGARDEKMWLTAKDALGLDGLKSAAFSAAFENKMWSMRAHVDAPRPRKGLLALLDAEPLDDATFKAVPKSASLVFAASLDLGRVYNEIRTAVGKFDTDALAEFDEGVQGVGSMLGIDLKTDLFEALGDQWVIYADNNTAGNGMLGFTIVNKLRKPKKFEKAALGVQNVAVNMINGLIDNNDMRIRSRSFTYDGKSMHMINAPAISPAWMVHDGHWVAGLYPQVVAAAGTQLSDGKDSILDNPRFAALRRQLGAQKANALAYYDLQATAGEGYQVMLLMSQLYLGLADMFGVDTPPMIIPPLNKIRPHLSPAMTATIAGDSSWHMTHVEPFPGSTMLGSSGNLMVSQQAMAVGILLPALGSARRTARMMQSGTQARGIHQGAVLWSNSANGQYPPDLATMLEGEFFTVEYLISPNANVDIPRDIYKWDKKKRAEWVNRNTSYCYVTGLNDDNDWKKVVVFEKILEGQKQDNIAIAFNDNHVERLPIAEASRLIKKQTGRSLAEWSKAKYPGAGGKN